MTALSTEEIIASRSLEKIVKPAYSPTSVDLYATGINGRKNKEYKGIKAYTKSFLYNKDTGEINIQVITGKEKSGLRWVSPKFNKIINGNILCSLKKQQHNNTSSFGLNYNLFGIDDWEVCVILFMREKKVLIYSRDDIENKGAPHFRGEELQFFVDVEESLFIPAESVMKLTLPKVRSWIESCLNNTSQ